MELFGEGKLKEGIFNSVFTKKIVRLSHCLVRMLDITKPSHNFVVVLLIGHYMF